MARRKIWKSDLEKDWENEKVKKTPKGFKVSFTKGVSIVDETGLWSDKVDVTVIADKKGFPKKFYFDGTETGILAMKDRQPELYWDAREILKRKLGKVV